MKKFLSEGLTIRSIDIWVNCQADAEKKSENQFSLSRKSRINHVKTHDHVVAHYSWDIQRARNPTSTVKTASDAIKLTPRSTIIRRLLMLFFCKAYHFVRFLKTLSPETCLEAIKPSNFSSGKTLSF